MLARPGVHVYLAYWTGLISTRLNTSCFTPHFLVLYARMRMTLGALSASWADALPPRSPKDLIIVRLGMTTE